MYWSDNYTSIDIIRWILLAANDPHTINKESLIEHAMQYGAAFGVLEGHIRSALMHRLEDLIFSTWGIRMERDWPKLDLWLPCMKCEKSYPEKFIEIFHYENEDYDLCPECRFALIEMKLEEFKVWKGGD